MFGSTDGWIYSLNIENGRLAWKFHAAPEEMQVGVKDQLESGWPVHGAVVIQNNTRYATAGRSTYLDGGIVLYRLNPETGEKISHTILSNIDPKTGIQTGSEKRGSFNIEGVTADIMSGDGEHVFLKHMVFNKDGREINENKTHLYSPTGMLRNPWFVRGFWRYAGNHGTGWGRWAQHPKKSAYGRILCRDGGTIYGYGRSQIASARPGHRLDRYHLFALKRWERNDFPLTVHAMVAGADNLTVAGTPDVGVRHGNQNVLRFLNPKEAAASFRGEKGVQLKLVSKKDGRELFTMDLDAVPVFDGMSAARGRLYMSLKDGSIACFSCNSQ